MDTGLLLVRLVLGLLMAAHGAQKLLGWFGGHGLAASRRLLRLARLPARPRLRRRGGRLRDRRRSADGARPLRPVRTGADAGGDDCRGHQRALAARPLRDVERHRGAAALRRRRRGVDAHRPGPLLARRLCSASLPAWTPSSHLDRRSPSASRAASSTWRCAGRRRTRELVVIAFGKETSSCLSDP